jgi:hypothetical protein
MSDEVAPELKEVVRQRLADKGVVKKIDHRIKVGMIAAIGELRGEKGSTTIFDGLGFDKPKIEIEALQAIYAYLKDVDLTWTLDCLINETQVQPAESDVALVPLLLAKEDPEEGPGGEDEKEEFADASDES